MEMLIQVVQMKIKVLTNKVKKLINRNKIMTLVLILLKKYKLLMQICCSLMTVFKCQKLLI